MPGSRVRVGKPAALFLVLLATVGTLRAEVFVVDRFDDANGACESGDCSLREALLAAEALPGADRIELPPGTHRLSIAGDAVSLAEGDLEILAHDVEVIAPQGATIDAQGIDRIFRFRDSTSRLVNLTLTGGDTRSEFFGGAIYSEGSQLDLEDLWVHDNHARIAGGGVAVEQGVVRIWRSTLSHNWTEGGGGGAYLLGVSQFQVGRLEIYNSTISSNHADLVGGAIRISAAGQLHLEYSSIVQNTNRAGDASLYTFLARPQADAVYSLVEGACTEGVEASCIFLSSKADELPVADLVVGPLAPNGGRGPTHELLPGSPALDVVPANASCPVADQRGTSRPLDGDVDGTALCDAGSYERRGPTAVEIPALGASGLGAFVLLLTAAASRRIRWHGEREQ